MIVERQENNFDLIRLLAAAFVIFSHAFGICGLKDPVLEFTGTLPGGQLAVYVFFVISGYLIAGSWFKRPKLIPYFEKRILRIYPALIVVLLISIFIFGPILTTLSLKEYFSASETYSYFINLSLWKMQYSLPGVTMHGEDLFFNTPIWTLFFEFIMYLSIAFLGMTGILKNKREGRWILWLLFIVFLFLDFYGIPKELFIMKISAFNFVRFFIYFYSGVLYYLYLKDRKMSGYIAFVSILAAIFYRDTVFFSFFSLVSITTSVFWFAFLDYHPLKFIVSRGDFSYGLYIYGCIIQNFIQYYTGCSIPLMIKIPLSLALTFPFAIFSWRLIESKFLKLKL